MDTFKDQQSERHDNIEPIYLELAKRVSGADTYYVPRIIKKMLTFEEAKLVRELPAPIDEIAKNLLLTRESVEKTFKELLRKGCVIKTEKGIKFLGNMAQFGDVLVVNPAYDSERGDEFF